MEKDAQFAAQMQSETEQDRTEQAALLTGKKYYIIFLN
jgi:hypothetical protein